MTPTTASFHLAIQDVVSAPAYQRRQRLCALMTAGVAFDDRVARYAEWLGKEDIGLTAMTSDPEFTAREDRWLERLTVYEESSRALGTALVMVGRE